MRIIPFPNEGLGDWWTDLQKLYAPAQTVVSSIGGLVAPETTAAIAAAAEQAKITVAPVAATAQQVADAAAQAKAIIDSQNATRVASGQPPLTSTEVAAVVDRVSRGITSMQPLLIGGAVALVAALVLMRSRK